MCKCCKCCKCFSCLTFGLPLGSALLLSAIISTTIAYESMMFFAEGIYWIIMKPLGEIRHEHYMAEVRVEINFFWRALELLLTIILLWYGTILKRKSICLKAWLISQVAFLAIWEIEALAETCRWLSLELHIMRPKLFVLPTASVLYHFALSGYVVNVGYRFLLRMDEPVDSASQEVGALEPTGKSVREIIKFYQVNTWEGAKLASVTEVLINFFSFFEQVESHFFSDTYAAFGTPTGVLVVDSFGQYGRFVLGLVAFVLIRERCRQLLLLWCLAYFAVLFSFASIFVYILTTGPEWKVYNTLATFHHNSSFFFSLIFQLWVFIMCVRYIAAENNRPRPVADPVVIVNE